MEALVRSRFSPGRCVVDKPFDLRVYENSQTIEVILQSHFGVDHWQQLENYYREQIGKGKVNWDLDLRNLGFLSSLLIGLIIGLNTILISRQGMLRLIIPKGSHLAEIFRIARLNRVLAILEV